MIPAYGESDLDAELVFDRILGKRDLNALQELLLNLAPAWSANLRAWQSPSDQRPIAVDECDALANAVLAAAAERATFMSGLQRLRNRLFPSRSNLPSA